MLTDGSDPVNLTNNPADDTDPAALWTTKYAFRKASVLLYLLQRP